MDKQRDLRLDLTKCVAILGTVLIHSSKYGYELGSLSWYAGVFWGSLLRSCVPLFLMCSGALFLAKPVSLRRLFTRTFPRILAAMLVWAMGYKIMRLAVDSAVTLPNLVQAVKEVLTFQHEFHFYYLHIILIVYLFLPITSVFVRAATRRQLQYALGVWFLLGILAPRLFAHWPFTLFGGVAYQYPMAQVYGAIGYGIWGHYIKTNPRSPRVWAACAIGGTALIFFGTVLLSLRTGGLFEGFLEGMAPGAFLQATGLFGLCHCVPPPEREATRKTIVFLSKGAFCVYLCHVFFIHLLERVGFTPYLLPALVGTPICVMVYLLCSYGVYGVLSHIPVVRRWLV